MRQDSPIDILSATSPAPLRVQLLGPVHIAVGNRVISDSEWPRRSARSLVILLAATPKHRLSRERIIDLLWPDASPEAGLNALRVALHALRRTLEPAMKPGTASAYIDTEGEFIRLRSTDGLWVDVDHFEEALARLSLVRVEERPDALRKAVSFYGGDMLADEPVTDWSLRRREQLRHLWRDAVLELSACDAERGSLQSVRDLERVLDTDPTDEAAHRALMKTFLAAGRRDKALRQYTRCVEALQLELEVEPDAETMALAAEIRAASAAGDLGAPTLYRGRIDNLPAPPNPLIGRARELEALEDILLDPDVRLVTITGPGGIGKTRLALEAARQAAGEFAAGVCFVDVSAITEPDLVLPTILRALGLDEAPGQLPLDVLVHAVRDLELLLVLDNFEQVVDAAGDIGSLLSSCPGLTVLATSREPLRLRAEHVVATPPLAVPPLRLSDSSREVSASSVARYAAVMLFADRAQAVRSDFAITDGNAHAVVALCTRLDGMPLAIELAAACSRYLAPDEMLERLAHRLPIPAAGSRDVPERHRTLRNTIAWSYDLLLPVEQEVFRRLAVFVGGFSLEAAEAVGSTFGIAAPEIDASIWRLVDKSLLELDDHAGREARRYRMLEPIRESGMGFLEESGELPAARNAHAKWYTEVAATAAGELTGPHPTAWLDTLEIEHDNLRAALTWCLTYSPANAIRMATALWRFWWVRGYVIEGRTWLQRVIELSDGVSLAERAAALFATAELSDVLSDHVSAIALHRQALHIFEELNDDVGRIECLNGWGNVERTLGNLDEAERLHNQALQLIPGSNHRRGEASTLNYLASVAYYRGDFAQAETHWERAVEIVRELGDLRSTGLLLGNLGSLALQVGLHQRAIDLQQESLTVARQMADPDGISRALINLGSACVEAGDLDRAREALEEGVVYSRQVEGTRVEASAQYTLGKIALLKQDYPSAGQPYLQSLMLSAKAGDLPGAATALEGLGRIATELSLHEDALRLFATAHRIRETTGVARENTEDAGFDQSVLRSRSAVEPHVAESSWEDGLNCSLGTVVALASDMVADLS